MIDLFKLELEKVYAEENFKRETVPLVKYRWWAIVKAINNLMKELSD